jgi:hypothetical protein
MNCQKSECPFHVKEREICGLLDSEARVPDPGRGKQSPNSLVVESLDIGRALADRGRVSFRAQGTCMYPCVRQGDTLHIESRTIEEVMVGDIAVVRRNGLLFGHRTIAKGSDAFGAYIVTRPDRSKKGNDGPTYADNILGIIAKIDRSGSGVSLEPKLLKGYAKMLVSLWEWWNWDARQLLIQRFEVIQRKPLYTFIASLYLQARYRNPLYEVQLPLKPMSAYDLYRRFPPDQFDVTMPLQKGMPVKEWTLTISLEGQRTPVASLTLTHRPEHCPKGDGWHSANSWVRTRYRGAGFEEKLVREAGKILARSSAALKYSKA